MALRDRHHTAEAVRITTVPRSRAEDIAARQKRYIYSMGLRTVCFVGAVVLGGMATLGIAAGWWFAFPDLRDVDEFPGAPRVES